MDGVPGLQGWPRRCSVDLLMFFCAFLKKVEKHYLLEPEVLGNLGRTYINQHCKIGDLEGEPGELSWGYEDFVF